MSHNTHTGARMISKPANDKFESGWNAIWGKKTKEDVQEILDSPSVMMPSGLSLEEMRELIIAHSEKSWPARWEEGAEPVRAVKELTEAELEHWAEMMGYNDKWEDLDD